MLDEKFQPIDFRTAVFAECEFEFFDIDYSPTITFATKA